MKTWIISICAVAIISSIISFVLPEGKMGKYIKGIFSLFIIFTIIKPLYYLKDSEFNYKLIFNDNNIEFQENYIEYFSQEKIEEYEKQCKKILQNYGISNSDIDIIYTLDNNFNIEIKYVNINLSNSVIISDKEHIDIIKEIRSKVASYLVININLVNIHE